MCPIRRSPRQRQLKTLIRTSRVKATLPAPQSELARDLVKAPYAFDFPGSQYKFEIDGDEFYIDLLFYHTKLHCYVVIEPKNTEFKCECTGHVNGYLAAVDDLVRDATVDAPTIGMILCKSKKKTMVEYALRGVDTPHGRIHLQNRFASSSTG